MWLPLTKLRRRFESNERFFVKCFYVFCVIMFIYQTIMVVVEYFNQDVSTTIEFIRDEKQEPLPYVQVCSQYWVDKHKLAAWNVSDELLEYMKAGFLGFVNFKGLRKSADLQRLDAEFTAFTDVHVDFDYRTFFKNVSLRRGRIMPYCRWEERNYPCDDLFEPVFTESGLCYLLRAERAPPQTIAGPAGGLRFLIARRAEREPRVIYNTGFDDGVHLSISGQWQPQLTDPLFIAMGKRAYLQIRRTEFKHLSGCTHDRRLTLFDERYSQAACLYECAVRRTLARCGCATFTYNVALTSDQFCTPAKFRRCMRPGVLVGNRTRLDVDDAQDECTNSCPKSCISDEITTTASYARNDPWRVEIYNKRKLRHWTNENTIMVHIYYSQIGHTSITENWTMTVATVLSNIGGQMGLWMGFSALSITTYVLKKYHRRFQSKKPGEVEVTENSAAEIQEIATPV